MQDDNSPMKGDDRGSVGGSSGEDRGSSADSQGTYGGGGARAYGGGGGAGQGPSGGEEVYDGLTEREVAFKMLAAHALVDAEFYWLLRKDPVLACNSIYIALEETDYEYLRSGIQWDHIDPYQEEIRAAVNANMVVRSLW